MPQKHIDDIPELKAEKQAMNRRTLKAMQVRWAGSCGRYVSASSGLRLHTRAWLLRLCELLRGPQASPACLQ